MKFTFLRAALVLCAALGLASCGGKATFQIQGTISGLVYPGLVLSTNGMDLTVPAGATTFVFPNTISYGEVFNLSSSGTGLPKSQPQHQTCGIANPTDTAGRTAVINVLVSCSLNQYSIGGTISGLTADGLVLTNGSTGGTLTVVNGATTFTFGAAVSYGSSYGVTVLTQPTGLTCNVTQNASGVMGDAAVSNIVIACTPN